MQAQREGRARERLHVSCATTIQRVWRGRSGLAVPVEAWSYCCLYRTVECGILLYQNVGRDWPHLEARSHMYLHTRVIFPDSPVDPPVCLVELTPVSAALCVVMMCHAARRGERRHVATPRSKRGLVYRLCRSAVRVGPTATQPHVSSHPVLAASVPCSKELLYTRRQLLSRVVFEVCSALLPAKATDRGCVLLLLVGTTFSLPLAPLIIPLFNSSKCFFHAILASLHRAPSPLNYLCRSCVGKWRHEERNAWDRKMHDVGRVKDMLASAGKVLQVKRCAVLNACLFRRMWCVCA